MLLQYFFAVYSNINCFRIWGHLAEPGFHKSPEYAGNNISNSYPNGIDAIAENKT